MLEKKLLILLMTNGCVLEQNEYFYFYLNIIILFDIHALSFLLDIIKWKSDYLSKSIVY